MGYFGNTVFSRTVSFREYSGNEYRYNFLFTPYLATICNLSQAVVKNADKTMKITYTLTEQVVSS